MTRLQLSIFLIGILLVIAAVGGTVGIKVGLEQAFPAALTAALVYVTATYVFLNAQVVTTAKLQARIMEESQLNSAAPVIELIFNGIILAEEQLHRDKRNPEWGTEVFIGWHNIGRGAALNFRCWIEDPEHPELRVQSRAICRTAIAVEDANHSSIGTGLQKYKLGVSYIRAQYESVFKKTYESCLLFSENTVPELKYGEANTDDIVIL